MSEKFVIIVAGGVGSRMNSTLPKQFHLLGDLPVLMHTIRRFAQADLGLHIVVVLSPSMLTYWEELRAKYQFEIQHYIVNGGNTRFQSVRNGLNCIQENFKSEQLHQAQIAVHDGARPLVSSGLIQNLFAVANELQAVIPAVQSTNSIRIGNKERSETADRDQVWQVQTPQVFAADLLFEGYNQEEHRSFTDDASVVEKMGNIVRILEGDHFNLKITHPEDLDIAQVYLDKLFT
jgi:2-C-methyl-D-erythritol 4-phosphate cytidylyltransferase